MFNNFSQLILFKCMQIAIKFRSDSQVRSNLEKKIWTELSVIYGAINTIKVIETRCKRVLLFESDRVFSITVFIHTSDISLSS